MPVLANRNDVTLRREPNAIGCPPSTIATLLDEAGTAMSEEKNTTIEEHAAGFLGAAVVDESFVITAVSDGVVNLGGIPARPLLDSR